MGRRLSLVAPYTGAWIEMFSDAVTKSGEFAVAPYTGAWIEIRQSRRYIRILAVAPYTGAWIEISAGLL